MVEEVKMPCEHGRIAMLEVSGLTKRYGRTVAVDNLSFTVERGTVTGFLGPNGAGKSTTMRIIVGLDRADAGAALIGGRVYGELEHPLRHVGVLLDARAFHPGRSARDHLRALAASNGIAARRVGQVLEAVGLTDVARKRVRSFSLGMSQRLGIAAALLGEPHTLLFDEPTNGLDPEGIRWVRGVFKNLASQGCTVLVSSHLMSEMALTADHLVVLGRGRLIAQTTTAAFLARSSRHFVRVRTPHAVQLSQSLRNRGAGVSIEDDGALAVTGIEIGAIAEIAAAGQIVVQELSPQSASLEEAFMELTESSVQYRGADATTRTQASE
jgi:ABC-2 type transport system ATP-binding protein